MLAKKAQALILALVIVSSLILLVVQLSGEGFDIVKPLEDDQIFRVLDEEKTPPVDVTSFIVTDTALILYYDSEGLLNLYSLEGEFLYGLQVETIQNGTGDIAFAEGLLYVRPRGNRMYVFRASELIDSFLYKEDPAKYQNICKLMEQDKNHTSGDEVYFYLAQSNKITKTSWQGEMVTVISLPQTDLNLAVDIMILLLLAAGVCYYLHNKSLTTQK